MLEVFPSQCGPFSVFFVLEIKKKKKKREKNQDDHQIAFVPVQADAVQTLQVLCVDDAGTSILT